jgi:nucleotide-binding universal stress UspA family protein
MAFEIGTDGIGALVVGFDGSEPSQDALAFSAGAARRNGARLIIVYAVEGGPRPSPRWPARPA